MKPLEEARENELLQLQSNAKRELEHSHHFSAPIGIDALPFSLMIPKECDCFTLRFIHVVDAFFPEKRSLSSLTGSFCNRIWMLRGWFSWFICIAGILALLGIGLHALAWLARDPARVQLKLSLNVSRHTSYVTRQTLKHRTCRAFRFVYS